MGKYVLIAEAHGILRTGLRSTFLDTPNVTQVYEVVTSEGLQKQLAHSPLDLVVINQSLAIDMELLPRGHFVILAAQPDRNILLAAYTYGALGYLSEHTSAELLRMTLRLIEGDFLLDPTFASGILDYMCIDTIPSVTSEVLTTREREVFDLIRAGLTNRAIANQLSISITTVKTHVSHIFRKLDIKRRPIKVVVTEPVRHQNP
jgi:DNA-binding NarL/FixJ family response regulator